MPTAPLVRRHYSVPWINALWHMDGHHKLGPWKIPIHGAIDGYSRMVLYLVACDNNRADTVLQAFDEATETYGVPSRVRGDYGKENWGVKMRMEVLRGVSYTELFMITLYYIEILLISFTGVDRGSFIAGPSTRNQRIERLWVDLQRWCTSRYRRLFLYLETQALLHPDNPYHIWSLHFCYIPMINHSLQRFIFKWNRHGIRTAPGSKSPQRMWMTSTSSILSCTRFRCQRNARSGSGSSTRPRSRSKPCWHGSRG